MTSIKGNAYSNSLIQYINLTSSCSQNKLNLTYLLAMENFQSHREVYTKTKKNGVI